jgi:hypothetical protein
MMFINFTGCGIKGNPVMPSRVPDHGQIVQNLQAVSSGDAVILNWDFFYGKDLKINYIAIEKSEVGSAGNECKTCPRTFKRIGRVPVKPVKPAKPAKEDGREKEYSSLSFKDKEVVRGKIYNYRLMLCDGYNVCLESSRAEIDFK